MNKNKSWIFVLLLFLTLFIPSGMLDLNADETEIQIDKLRSEGYVAFIVNSTEAKDINVPVDECDCKGTGVMVHGDGHKTPCQCYTSGTNNVCNCPKTQISEETKKCGCDSSEEWVECNCKENTQSVNKDPDPVKKNKIKILYFTASWCAPCQLLKSTELPKLDKLGLKNSIYGDKTETEIELVDVDKMPSVYAKYKKNRRYIPLLVFVDEGGIEKGYLMGYNTSNTIWKKYNDLN